MNNRKKVWLSTGLATVLLLSVTACSKDENPSTTDPSSQVTKKKDPIELVFYYPATTDWNAENFDRVFGQLGGLIENGWQKAVFGLLSHQNVA